MAGKDNQFDDSARKDLDRRLNDLNKRLGRDKKEDKEKSSGPSSRNSYGNAFRLSSEFVSAILVGTIIGYGIDWLAGTTPWAMILFLLLGFVAGVLNVLRAAGELSDPRDQLKSDQQSEAKQEDKYPY